MSIRSLTCHQSVLKRCGSAKNFSEFFPTRWRQKINWHRYGTKLRHCTRLPGARFTKYLTTILRLSYDNAKVTTDPRPASSLQNTSRTTQGFSLVGLRLACKIVRAVCDSFRKLASTIPNRNRSTVYFEYLLNNM